MSARKEFEEPKLCGFYPFRVVGEETAGIDRTVCYFLPVGHTLYVWMLQLLQLSFSGEMKKKILNG